MIWEKLRIPAKATFKNPDFRSLGEFGKTWSKIQKSQFWIKDPRFLVQGVKVSILNQYINWEKFCPNLLFTAENQMGNLCKIGHISNLTWWKMPTLWNSEVNRGHSGTSNCGGIGLLLYA